MFVDKTRSLSYSGVPERSLTWVGSGLLKGKAKYRLGNCDSFMKRKISVINETKLDEISLKPKV